MHILPGINKQHAKSSYGHKFHNQGQRKMCTKYTYLTGGADITYCSLVYFCLEEGWESFSKFRQSFECLQIIRTLRCKSRLSSTILFYTLLLQICSTHFFYHSVLHSSSNILFYTLLLTFCSTPFFYHCSTPFFYHSVLHPSSNILFNTLLLPFCSTLFF